jgi:Spy/CpxP family protein refolding chaperone
MKKASVFFALCFLLSLIAALTSYAEPKVPASKMEKELKNEAHPSLMMPPPCGARPIKGIPGLPHFPQLNLRSLNLNEKQKEAIKEIENSAAKELIRKKADEQIAEIELGELLAKDTVDLKAVEIKLKQIGIIKTESQLLIIKSVEKMKEKLTPQQRTILKKQVVGFRMKPPLKEKMKPGTPLFAGEKR